ncbi:hypothetical protein GCM10010276_22340 [Streptomyces longisporus]|uniref:Uncharacterized protein n=1 Tax=Streptomyces longisporus TaxID=1948 RepID=A0ABP5YVS3_STRLO
MAGADGHLLLHRVLLLQTRPHRGRPSRRGRAYAPAAGLRFSDDVDVPSEPGSQLASSKHTNTTVDAARRMERMMTPHRQATTEQMLAHRPDTTPRGVAREEAR